MNKPSGMLFDLQDTIIGGLEYDPLAGTARMLGLAQGDAMGSPVHALEFLRILEEEVFE